MNILAVGPFIGDIKQEVLTFRPYVKWLTIVKQYDKIFISIYSDRSFLYNDIEADFDILPVEVENDQSKQKGLVNTDITQKQYNKIVKDFKDSIYKLGYKKRDIEVIPMKYRKLQIQYPTHNQLFTPIPRISNDRLRDLYGKVCFIPLNGIDYTIYDKIQSNVIIIGEDGLILDKNFHKLSYEDMFSVISNSKGIITPLGYYTFLANLQGVPVFSWGDEVSLYREGGIYNFGNKCKILPDICGDILTDSIKRFIKEIVNE